MYIKYYQVQQEQEAGALNVSFLSLASYLTPPSVLVRFDDPSVPVP